MTLFVEDLFAYLSGLGITADDRFYPNTFPQGVTYPAVVYFLVSSPREYTHSGASGFRSSRWQMSCWAETYLAARTLAVDLADALGGYVGALGSRQVQPVFVDELRDHYEPEQGLHWVSVDVVIQYVEEA